MQCATCWAFAASGALESKAAIEKGSEAPELSEQQLVDCVVTGYAPDASGCPPGKTCLGPVYIPLQWVFRVMNVWYGRRKYLGPILTGNSWRDPRPVRARIRTGPKQSWRILTGGGPGRMAILTAIRTQTRQDCPSAHPCSARMTVRMNPDGPGQSGQGPNFPTVSLSRIQQVILSNRAHLGWPVQQRPSIRLAPSYESL